MRPEIGQRGDKVDYNYTEWLNEVEQKAIEVNGRCFKRPTAASVRKAQNFASLFLGFVSLNRQILMSSLERRLEESLSAHESYDSLTRGSFNSQGLVRS